MNLVLVCLLCLPSALALRLDTRLAGQRESYFYGARSKPTAAPSQTLYSPPPAVERESARAPASPSSRASYSFGARNPQVGRLVGEPAESCGLSRGRSDERPSTPATVSSQQRGSGKVDYSFGARLRTPSVQRTEVVSASEPVFSSRSVETPSTRSAKTDYSFGARLRPPSVQRTEVVSASEPVFSSRSVETPSARSGKIDYSFGARLKRAESVGSDFPSRASSTRPEELRREEAAAPNEVNYSIGARLKTIPSPRTNIATLANADIPFSRSLHRSSMPSSAAHPGVIYPIGTRLLRGGEFESALRAQKLVTEESHISFESRDSPSKESYSFGARLTSSNNRSGFLVGL